MAWWEVVLDRVNSKDPLITPGRGLQGTRRQPFTILSKNSSQLIIASGHSEIPLEKECFDVIERAFTRNPSLWLRVASLHDSEPLEDSADKLIRKATGSQLARGNYVCSILERCGLVRYSMHENRKGIELPKIIEVDRPTNFITLRQEPKRNHQIDQSKLLQIWELVRWFDNARWDEEEVKTMIIPGPVFKLLVNSKKVLVHWLCYITDQQRPYQDVWMKGGPIFAELVSKYTVNTNPSLVLLKDFTRPGNKIDSIDTFTSKNQVIDGERIEYTPRFGMHILSIARTLCILESYQRDIVRYLSRFWEFIEGGTQGVDGDNRVSRIAFLLYLLSYKDIKRGMLSYHRNEKEIKSNVRNYGKRLEKLFANKEELVFQFRKWSKRDRYHKRLWAALRDYVKPMSPFREYLIGGLHDTGEEGFEAFLKDEQQEILESLELPGDVWNLRFIEKIFEGKIKSPGELRREYQSLKLSHSIGARFYPEQFDVSFSFSPYMCEEMMEEYCPLRKNSRIKEYCLHALGMPIRDKLCPVAMITCGYTYYCEPGECPIKNGVQDDLCSGCSTKIERTKNMQNR